MYQFIKKRDKRNEFDTVDVRVNTEAITIDGVIEDFAGFLKACGFSSDLVDISLGLKEDE